LLSPIQKLVEAIRRKANMRKPKVKMLKGSGSDVVDLNINALKSAGYSHKHATHFALRHANKKNSAKKLKTVGEKVATKNDSMAGILD
jgi:hypothetical protein